MVDSLQRLKVAAEPPVHVLIVDDKPANLDALEAILRDTRFAIDRAESGSEALRRLLRRQYACCLLDIRMPEMDGFETAQLIRQDVELRHMPIIFVTAEAADQREVFRGYEAGAVDFLIKPLEPAIVRSKVRVLGELYRQKIKLARSEANEALNEQLKRANESLNTANRDLEHYTHIAAHDLREPLRKQRNLIDLLKRKVAGTASVTELIGHLEDSADQMLKMIDELRSLTKIDYADLKRERIDLGGLVQSCLEDFRERSTERRAVISFETELGEELVYGPLVRILYANVIRNAFDHVAGSGFRLEFTAEHSGGNRPTVYGVRNTGSTVARDQLYEIFKIFRKGHASSNANSGVGLSICKRVIDRHRGRIHVESGPDHVHVKFTFGSPE
jgi:hypothetical protein